MNRYWLFGGETKDHTVSEYENNMDDEIVRLENEKDDDYHDFEKWYESQQERFRKGNFSSKDESYAAFRYGVECGMDLVYGSTWGGNE